MTAKIKSYKKHRKPRQAYKPRGVTDKNFKKVYWPYLPVILVIGVLLTLSSSAGALSSFVQHRGNVLAYATSMSGSGLLSSTNAARSQNSVNSLKINSRLNAAAQAKANDMAERNYWSHNTPEGDPPWVFVSAQKYAYQKLGENLAAGFDDEQSTVDGWMASPPHKANMLDPAFSDVGFGFANNSNYTSAGGGPMTIVVAFYGKPKVLSATATAPASTTTNSVSQSKPSSKATSTQAAAKKQTLPSKPKNVPAQLPNTESAIPTAPSVARQSNAQIALAFSPLAQFGTTFVLICLFAAAGIWLSRHALSVRRAVFQGETFAIRHPLMDIGLIVIVALSFLLSQTAGLIQ